MDRLGPSHHVGNTFSDRLSHCDTRLSAIVHDLVASLQGLIVKHDVSREELGAAIRFATDVGVASDEKRQEWVLFSDAMGLSDLVEKIGVCRPDHATPQTLMGPFFREGAPHKACGDTISLDGIGIPMVFDARIVDLNRSPVAGATVDVWQANADGTFENQNPDSQPEFNLRGRFVSDAEGRVTFRTVRPGGYSLPADGPVADLLRALGLSLRRPAHIQFRITAPGFQTLVTHVFDRNDPDIGADPLFCVAPDLLADFRAQTSNGRPVARFTFKIAPTPPGQLHH